MKSDFTLRLKHEDKKLAQGAAREALELIDKIEEKLNRYLPGSDVWQINHMEAGQTLYLNELCYECLLEGLKAYEQTGGLFDITIGQRIEHRKNKQTSPPPQITGQLVLVPNQAAIQCNEPGREIDLGGIGKGFALDQAKQVIQEWGVEAGILSAGASTHLAFGPQEWRLGLSAKKETHDIKLKNQALSASGSAIQDAHIVSPVDDGQTYPHPRVWVLHESATWADVWSTSAMLMSPEELSQCTEHFAQLFAEDPETGKVVRLYPKDAAEHHSA